MRERASRSLQAAANGVQFDKPRDGEGHERNERRRGRVRTVERARAHQEHGQARIRVD